MHSDAAVEPRKTESASDRVELKVSVVVVVYRIGKFPLLPHIESEFTIFRPLSLRSILMSWFSKRALPFKFLRQISVFTSLLPHSSPLIPFDFIVLIIYDEQYK